MPFILFCGFPCSGKSTKAAEFKEYISNSTNENVHIISEDELGIDKNAVYSDSRKEKDIRSSLKSSVLRKIAKDEFVILDSLNYIKGFRYELFCVTKSAQTPHCVIYCAINKDKAKEWNSCREGPKYTDEVIDQLIMRFEEPDSRNRWDSPLFTVQVDDKLPSQEIYEVLINKKPPPPNQSTMSQPLSSTNFLYELDRISKEIVSAVLDVQKTAVPGESIKILNATEKVILSKHLTMAELQRIRRQFLTYMKMHPCDINNISNVFVQFLNNSIH